jgi:hypothetical protein
VPASCSVVRASDPPDGEGDVGVTEDWAQPMASDATTSGAKTERKQFMADATCNSAAISTAPLKSRATRDRARAERRPCDSEMTLPIVVARVEDGTTTVAEAMIVA